MRLSPPLLFLYLILIPVSIFAQSRDEARFIDGELVPPLPKNPAKRAAVLAELKVRFPAPAPSANSIGLGLVKALQAHPVGDIVPTPAPATLGARTPARFDIDLPPNESSSAATLFSMGGFDAIDDTGFIPADVHLAAGPEHVIAISNDIIRVWDKCGDVVVTLTMSAMTSFGALSYSGGRIIYDQWNDRYILAFICSDFGGSFGRVILYSIEDPADIDTWFFYDINLSLGAGRFADFIDIGADPNNIYLTFNRFNFGTFVFDGAQIVVTDGTDFYNAGSTLFYYNALGNNPGNGLPASAVRVAKMRSYGGAQYLINTHPSGGNFLTFWTVTGPANAPVVTPTNIPFGASTYVPPPNIQQPDGTYLEAGDARLYDAAYYLNDLFAVGGYGAGGSALTGAYMLSATGTVGSYASFRAVANGHNALFPSVDIDNTGNPIYNFTEVSGTVFPSARTMTQETCCLIAGPRYGTGLANYAGGGAGTNGSPYKWGNTSGVCVDPSGDRVWVIGMYASDDPIPSWDSRIQLVTTGSFASPQFDGPADVRWGGPQFGPFSPGPQTYKIKNPSGVTKTWRLSNVPSWLNPTATYGEIAPGDSALIQVVLDPSVSSSPPFLGSATLVLEECPANIAAIYDVTLSIGANACLKGQVDLDPGFGTFGTLMSDSEERGAFVTALADFVVCAVGLEIDLPIGTTITANIYEAVGDSRGSLLTSASNFTYATGKTMHYVNLLQVLDECEDYDIAFTIEPNNGWEYWNVGAPPSSFDARGVIRVRNGDLNGNPAVELPVIAVLGSEVSCAQKTDLGAPGETPSLPAVAETDRGMYVTALRSLRMCSLGFYASLPVNVILTARIYEAGTTTRGALIAEAPIEAPGGGGIMLHSVPISAVLLEGEFYNLSIEYPSASAVEVYDENNVAIPWEVAGVMRVRDGEIGGNAADTFVPHFEIGWDHVGGGSYFDLSPSTGVLGTGTSSNIGRGLYMQALHDQQIYAVSWRADVPEGETIRAHVYDGTGGSQGALISTGTIFSGGDGTRWHDIPVEVDFRQNESYNVVIEWDNANDYPQWTGLTNFWSPYGLLFVFDASDETGLTNGEVIHMRLRSCGGRGGQATAVGDTPLRTPMYLKPPSPNPASGLATFRFQLEEAGPANITIYDVKGRRVAEVLRESRLPAGPQDAIFDTRALPSGVYFVRLQTGRASVTRKLVVSH